MSLTNMNLNWKYIKSYAKEAGLMKKINEEKDLWPEHNDRYMVVKTPEGRWTAIVKLDNKNGGYVGRYEGFMKV